MAKTIKKLVLPVAGKGTRLRPLTNDRPKALVQLNKKPLLHYVLDEAQKAGLREIVLIINPEQKQLFQDYFKENPYPNFKFHFRIQKQLLGNGHSILMAADLIKNEPVAVRFSDDILFTREEKSSLNRAIDFFEAKRSPMILLKEVPKEEVFKYGIVKIRKTENLELKKIVKIVEKPPIEEAPSNLAVLGLYILTPEIIRNLEILEKSMPLVNDALPLTEALHLHLEKRGELFGFINGDNHFDCGGLAGLEGAEKYLTEI